MIDAVPYNNEDIYCVGNNLFSPLRENELKTVLQNTRIYRIDYNGVLKEISEDLLYRYILK